MKEQFWVKHSSENFVEYLHIFLEFAWTIAENPNGTVDVIFNTTLYVDQKAIDCNVTRRKCKSGECIKESDVVEDSIFWLPKSTCAGATSLVLVYFYYFVWKS